MHTKYSRRSAVSWASPPSIYVLLV